MNFLPRSHWLPNAVQTAGPQEISRHHQVLVIGGGYTGLSTAYELARLGKDVLVLEQLYCGYGASGRNAGHLTPTMGKDPAFLLDIFGAAKAAELVKIGEQAVIHTEKLIRDKGIHCDLRLRGNMLAAVNGRQLRKLEKTFEKIRFLSGHYEFTLKKNGLPDFFHGGIRENIGGTLHPGKYLSGLKEAASSAGAAILEGTTVHRLSGKEGSFLVETSRGEFRAEQIAICTNAFVHGLGLLKLRTVPVTVSMLETDPLPARVKQRIGWNDGCGIYTAHEILESHRISEQDTIVSGSKSVHYGFGGRKRGLSPRRQYELIEKTLRKRFPEASQVKVRSFWSGPILFALDFLPIVRKERGLHFALAFAGHGIAMGTYAGLLTARSIAEGKDSGWLSSRFLMPIPPEPLRYPLVNAIIGTLRFLDKRNGD